MKKIADLVFKDDVIDNIKNVIVDGKKFKVRNNGNWYNYRRKQVTQFTLYDYSDKPKPINVSIEEFVEYYVDNSFVDNIKVVVLSSAQTPESLIKSKNYHIISKKATNINDEEKIKRLLINQNINILISCPYIYTINLYSGEVERISQYDEFISKNITIIKNYKNNKVPAGILRYYMLNQNEEIIIVSGKCFKSHSNIDGFDKKSEYNIFTFDNSNNDNVDKLVELLFYQSLIGNIVSDDNNIMYYYLKNEKIEGKQL